MKRIGYLILLLGLLAACLLACGRDPLPPPDGTAETEATAATTATAAATSTEAVTETELPAAVMALIRDGVANYRIIRPDDALPTEVSGAMLIRETVGKATGIYPELSTDWVRRGTERDHETTEILIGATAYEESAKALEGIPYGDYIVTKIGNKLVINAWSAEGLNRAVSLFCGEVQKHAAKDSLALEESLLITGTAVPLANELPVYEGGTLTSVYHAGDRNQLLIFGETTPDAYASYCQKLASAGYALYTENQITDNRFAVYVNDQYTVNVGYYAYEKAARVIIEPRTTLPPLAEENHYEGLVTPSVAMLGLEYDRDGSLSQNGLCLIFQLADGSYIIVDGGFNRARDAKALYDYMYEHAPDKQRITVAAWLITHAHGDHHGAYYNFSDNYADLVTVEYVIGNFPSEEARLEGELGTDGSGGSNIMSRVSKFAGAQFIKAHTGYVFALRDAKIEILYTLESFAPGVLSYFNTSSLVFTVELGSQKFMILGDASNDACSIVNKMYGDALKSDFVQTAHHGYTTGSSQYSGLTAVYDKTAASVVLWPLGQKEYPGMSGRIFSKHLQELATTKEIFVAGARDIRLMLPYSVGTSGFESILK